MFNTLWNLTTQDAQVDCFRNAAAHLEPGGCFVVELFVPGLQRLLPGETFLPFVVTPTHLGIDEYDVVTQSLVSHHYRPGAVGADHLAVPGRYVWPAELDLMARLAGMSLRERWADWEPRAVHQRERIARVGVAEGLIANVAAAAPGVARHGGPRSSRPARRSRWVFSQWWGVQRSSRFSPEVGPPAATGTRDRSRDRGGARSRARRTDARRTRAAHRSRGRCASRR